MSELPLLGVIATSAKPDERRLPIHPAHIERIDAAIRARMVLEAGYGARFGVSDERLAGLVGELRPRGDVLAGADVVVLPKPEAADLLAVREGTVVWGWPHCVQGDAITQAAIDRRLTLIAWEAMNRWAPDGTFETHVFRANNELAGYCSVLHALGLTGRTGAYGRRLRAAVIGAGLTSRGAVRALEALGVDDVVVCAPAVPPAVTAPLDVLAGRDVVVNCIFQDTDAPQTFVTRRDLGRFAEGTLFIDVSCDEGMGFEWSRPTSFREPLRGLEGGMHFYAVDHSPSYLWDSATWEISEALLPYLPAVVAGPAAWDADETIRRAVEIREGVIQNPKILSFQGRRPEFPHLRSA